MIPFISICIPAFKRVEYLKRLLDSISIQSYKNFEVVVTDDSPGIDVSDLCDQYKDKFQLQYFKNKTPLGSPENWNESIRHSKGSWIKMMHDDDWFSNADSLQIFTDATTKYPKSSFIFSGFCDIDMKKNKKQEFIISRSTLRLLHRSPLYLFKRNFIGHPSTTLVRKNETAFYDRNLKWVVDFEFYMRYLGHNDGLIAIREPLINIGLNEFQVTRESFRNPAVEIPEVIYLYYTLPKRSLKNIFVYDYYWRFIRNLCIRSVTDLEQYAHGDVAIPVVITKMITLQAKWAPGMLRNGFISKGLMFFSYLANYFIL